MLSENYRTVERVFHVLQRLAIEVLSVRKYTDRLTEDAKKGKAKIKKAYNR